MRLTPSALQGLSNERGVVTQRLNRTAAEYIVGGRECSDEPAVGALLYGVSGDRSMHCTGTLISPRAVLTAAHCIEGFDITRLTFLIGDNIALPVVESRVVYAERHPDYQRGVLGTADVGVVFLESPIRNIAAVPYAREPFLGSEQQLKFIGYGFSTEEHQLSELGQKRCVTMPIAEVFCETFRYEVPGRNTCNGDSGGPALSHASGRWEIVGVTSYGDSRCTAYGVDVNVGHYADWISATLYDRDQRPQNCSPGEWRPISDEWENRQVSALTCGQGSPLLELGRGTEYRISASGEWCYRCEPNDENDPHCGAPVPARGCSSSGATRGGSSYPCASCAQGALIACFADGDRECLLVGEALTLSGDVHANRSFYLRINDSQCSEDGNSGGVNRGHLTARVEMRTMCSGADEGPTADAAPETEPVLPDDLEAAEVSPRRAAGGTPNEGSGAVAAQAAPEACPSWVGARCATQGCNGTPGTPPRIQQGSNFENRPMSGDYSNTNFHGARLDSSRWSAGSSLRSSNLHGADLGNAILQGVSLWGACLHGADFRQADLRNADLRCVCAHGADFRGANRTGARWEGAVTTGARM